MIAETIVLLLRSDGQRRSQLEPDGRIVAGTLRGRSVFDFAMSAHSEGWDRWPVELFFTVTEDGYWTRFAVRGRGTGTLRQIGDLWFARWVLEIGEVDMEMRGGIR